MKNKTKPQEQGKHTPGPWTYEMEKRKQYGQTIYTAHILPAGPDAAFSIARLDPVTTPEHAEANARLIAAAPDLLTVLIQAVESSGFSLSGPTDVRAAEHNEPAWVCNARAVIAKAGAK